MREVSYGISLALSCFDRQRPQEVVRTLLVTGASDLRCLGATVTAAGAVEKWAPEWGRNMRTDFS